MDDSIIELVREALLIAMKISTPILLAGIAIGLFVSVVQSVTQIQEQTLTLVPKIFVMVVVAIAMLPWIVGRIADFAIEMFGLT